MELMNYLYELLAFWAFGSVLSGVTILYEKKSLQFIKRTSGLFTAVLFFCAFAIGSYLSIGAVYHVSQEQIKRGR